jgi:REP element-mobilizing transposase RayT
LHRGTWGGARPGAGRPKAERAGVPHRTRARVTRHEVVHVTWRLVRGIPSIRKSKRYRVIERALRAGREKRALGPRRGHFRLVEFSVQRDHLHLLVEAGDEIALARGLQGLGIRIARRLNKHLGRRGRLLRDRYHARILRKPREVRHCLVYVLNNRRKHMRQEGLPVPASTWCDPCSSGPSFTGWQRSPPDAIPPPDPVVAPARTWLMTTGWKRHGKIPLDAAPSP